MYAFIIVQLTNVYICTTISPLISHTDCNHLTIVIVAPIVYNGKWITFLTVTRPALRWSNRSPSKASNYYYKRFKKSIVVVVNYVDHYIAKDYTVPTQSVTLLKHNIVPTQSVTLGSHCMSSSCWAWIPYDIYGNSSSCMDCLRKSNANGVIRCSKILNKFKQSYHMLPVVST